MNGSSNTRVCSTPQYTLGITPAVKIRPSRRLLVGLDLGLTEEKQKLYNAYGQLVGILNEEIPAECSYGRLLGLVVD